MVTSHPPRRRRTKGGGEAPHEPPLEGEELPPESEELPPESEEYVSPEAGLGVEEVAMKAETEVEREEQSLPPAKETITGGLGAVGTTVKDGLVQSLKGIEEIESEIVSMVRQTVSDALRATGSMANEGVGVTRDVVLGALAATQEVGTGAVNATKSVAKGIILGVADVGGDLVTTADTVARTVVKGVAAVVQRTVRKIDLAARYGGEEFAVLLDEIDGKEARKLAERIRNEVKEQLFASDKGQFKVTISIGMAVFPDDGPDKTAIIAHADQALYGAKHGGRDRVVAWEDMGKSKATAA